MSDSRQGAQGRSISLASEHRGRVQRVQVTACGIEYPAEAIVAGSWDDDLGLPLSIPAGQNGPESS